MNTISLSLVIWSALFIPQQSYSADAAAAGTRPQRTHRNRHQNSYSQQLTASTRSSNRSRPYTKKNSPVMAAAAAPTHQSNLTDRNSMAVLAAAAASNGQTQTQAAEQTPLAIAVASATAQLQLDRLETGVNALSTQAAAALVATNQNFTTTQNYVYNSGVQLLDTINKGNTSIKEQLDTRMQEADVKMAHLHANTVNLDPKMTASELKLDALQQQTATVSATSTNSYNLLITVHDLLQQLLERQAVSAQQLLQQQEAMNRHMRTMNQHALAISQQVQRTGQQITKMEQNMGHMTCHMQSMDRFMQAMHQYIQKIDRNSESMDKNTQTMAQQIQRIDQQLQVAALVHQLPANNNNFTSSPIASDNDNGLINATDLNGIDSVIS